MNRAEIDIALRRADQPQYVIAGIASTPRLDRQNDVLEPLGAQYKLPLPLLWMHDSARPIGQVEYAKATAEGIEFRARLVNPATVSSEVLRDIIQRAWDSVTLGLTPSVSVGFRPITTSRLDSGGTRFTAWEWLELSVVSIPAQPDARIVSAKAVTDSQRHAATHVVQLIDPRPRKAGVVYLDPPKPTRIERLIAEGRAAEREKAKEAEKAERAVREHRARQWRWINGGNGQ